MVDIKVIGGGMGSPRKGKKVAYAKLVESYEEEDKRVNRKFI